MNNGNGITAKPWRQGRLLWALLPVAAVLVAGCAGAPRQEPRATDDKVSCQAAAQGDEWVGNWLGVNKREGIAGALHVLFTLRQDGTMAYTEQLKRSGKSPQTLNETGCWHRNAETLVMRTTHSNAVAVEPGDPIYTNEYPARMSAGRLVLDGPAGPFTLKRMPDDYRLPMF